MRTVTRNNKSNWKEVTSGVPQGSVLAPIMFAVYINDMAEGVTSYMNTFADDAKILRKVTKEEDRNTLNQGLEKISAWSRKWEMEFNSKWCSVLKFGKSERRIAGNYTISTMKELRQKQRKKVLE